MPRLTPGQYRVVRLRALARSDRQVAHELGIAEQTVKNQVRKARERFGVQTFVGLLIELGWLRVPE